MDYLSTTLDILSIIVVVIVLSAIIWAMLRYYEIIEQERAAEEKKLDQETVEKYGKMWKNRLHPYSNQESAETVRNQNTLYPDSNPRNLLSSQATSSIQISTTSAPERVVEMGTGAKMWCG